MDFSIRLDPSSVDFAMMLPQCSHITRKRGIYYYRRRLPQHPTRELTLSLRTRCFREAEWLAAKLDEEFTSIMSSLRNNGQADIQKVAREYLKGVLEYDLLVRQRQAGQALTGWTKWSSSLEFADEELEKAKGELAGRGKPERHAELVDWLMQQHGVSEDQRQELFFAILRAHVAQWETLRERARGNYTYVPHDLDEEPSPQSQDAAVAHSPSTGFLLTETLPNFLDFMSKDEGWRGQTLAQNKATYAMFIQCCNDLPVTDYERKHCAAFYDLLRGLPKLYSKSAEWRGLPLLEIAKQTQKQEHERLAMKTIKRHFSALGRLFAYLKQRGEYLGENPAYGFDFPDKRRARTKRSMWEGEPLRRLFASPVWTGCLSESRRSRPGKLIIKDEKYWLPLLGLYHGNRLEEFAQLCRSDIREAEGIWFLDINDDDRKQVKNEQSKRRVPLHPEVHRLGFLDYVEKTAPNPEDRVFPLLRPGGPDQKFGYFFTKWWSRYRRDIGLYEKGLDYHSFRSGVATRLAAFGVSLEIRNELLGHEGSSVDERSYQKGFPLKLLAESISLVSWPEVSL
jgi:site-specific recombinase XerD